MVGTPPVPVINEALYVKVRPGTVEDHNFVYDSWIKSYKGALDAGQPGSARRDDFYRSMRRRIDFMLQRGATLLIASFPEDPNHIAGFCCTEADVLHYVYVKLPYRKQGIAQKLLTQALPAGRALQTTHWTHFAADISLRKPGLVRYVGTDVPVVLIPEQELLRAS